MSRIDVVRSAIIGSNNHGANPDLYADDFQHTDELGGPPMDKNTWLAMSPVMFASFPDIEFVIEEIAEQGDQVRLVGHFVGTFTNDFDLSAMGMGVIPATGAKITFSTNTDLVTVEGGKITRWHGTDTGPDAGMTGFLKALGAG